MMNIYQHFREDEQSLLIKLLTGFYKSKINMPLI